MFYTKMTLRLGEAEKYTRGPRRTVEFFYDVLLVRWSTGFVGKPAPGPILGLKRIVHDFQ
jgi:hypothetical protein